jgi:hypothetical protein
MIDLAKDSARYFGTGKKEPEYLDFTSKGELKPTADAEIIYDLAKQMIEQLRKERDEAISALRSIRGEDGS